MIETRFTSMFVDLFLIFLIYFQDNVWCPRRVARTWGGRRLLHGPMHCLPIKVSHGKMPLLWIIWCTRSFPEPLNPCLTNILCSFSNVVISINWLSQIVMWSEKDSINYLLVRMCSLSYLLRYFPLVISLVRNDQMFLNVKVKYFFYFHPDVCLHVQDLHFIFLYIYFWSNIQRDHKRFQPKWPNLPWHIGNTSRVFVFAVGNRILLMSIDNQVPNINMLMLNEILRTFCEYIKHEETKTNVGWNSTQFPES